QPILDLCKSGLSAIRYDSYFLIVNLIVHAPYGSIVTDITLGFDDSSAPSTQAPPLTTTATTRSPQPPSTSASSSLS
ncbi:hypothetical protein BpHYR1_017953, partial [Brachionus plicatilis]